MKYVKLGRTGLTVSRIALGMMTYGTPNWRPWVMEEEPSRAVVRHAVEQGINFFDTADMYSAGESEVLTGKFVREFCRREEVVIATKAYYPVSLDLKGGNSAAAKPDRVPNADGLSRKRLFHAVDDSLKRLGTDYIDLWQIHRLDHDTPIEETMQALHDIVKSGKVRYIGASSMFAWQFAKAQQVAQQRGWTRFVSMQPELSLLYREEEREMLPLCRDQGVAVLPWSPLARGRLARPWGEHTPRIASDAFGAKLFERTKDNDQDIVKALGRLAVQRGVPRAQLALAWLLDTPGVTAPIIGASKPQHLLDAVAALSVSLSAEERAALEAPYQPHPVVGFE